MSVNVQCPIGPINQPVLVTALTTALGTTFLRIDTGIPDHVLVRLIDTATIGDQNTAIAVCAAHTGHPDPAIAQDAANLTDVNGRWLVSQFHGKTPAQIFTQIQSDVDGWTTLAQAKASLRVLLPTLAAAIAATAMKDQ